jgi:hypothetical protein
MKGVCCLRPVSKPLALSWDLAIVLETISQQPFEPLESVELKYVPLLLMAILLDRRGYYIYTFLVDGAVKKVEQCFIMDTDFSPS